VPPRHQKWRGGRALRRTSILTDRNFIVEDYLESQYDDEPLTVEDWDAIREGKEAIRRGEFISLGELEKELSLPITDYRSEC